MPDLYIIAGCNGAGKTTGSLTILPEILHCKEFVNADVIAAAISPSDFESVRIQAGRLMLQKMNGLLEKRIDFAFETSLSTRSYVSFISRAKEYGYRVTLLFFWLESPAMARDRVDTRVLKGGHNISSDVIERRYYRGIKNLYDLYMPVCDKWIVVDNIIKPKVIAKGNIHSSKFFNKTIWNMIVSQSNEVREAQMPYEDETDHIFDNIMAGLRKAYRNLVIESAAGDESLVVSIDGKVRHVPAKELMHTIDD